MKEQLIARWLGGLAAVVAPMSADDTKGRISQMAPLLAAEFDAAAFTQRSMAHVARGCEFFPTFKALADRLSDWCRDQRQTKPLQITADAPDAIAARAHEAERAEWNMPGVAVAAIERVEADLAADLAYAAMAARVLRVTLERYAPQHIPTLDAVTAAHDARRAAYTPKPAPTQMDEPKRAWEPSAVNPAHLAALRAQAGIRPINAGGAA